MVLQAALALRKADAVLVEELAPEHLVAGHALDQGRRGEGHPLAGPCSNSVMGVFRPWPHDLADHDVGVVAPTHRVHPLERLGAEAVVGVDEVDVLPARGVDPEVAGRPGQPELAMWMTRTFPCASASASKRAAVSSVEPSSTRITSYWSAGMDW